VRGVEICHVPTHLKFKLYFMSNIVFKHLYYKVKATYCDHFGTESDNINRMIAKSHLQIYNLLLIRSTKWTFGT
jgi:hypothetical protein